MFIHLFTHLSDILLSLFILRLKFSKIWPVGTSLICKFDMPSSFFEPFLTLWHSKKGSSCTQLAWPWNQPFLQVVLVFLVRNDIYKLRSLSKQELKNIVDMSISIYIYICVCITMSSCWYLWFHSTPQSDSLASLNF